MTLDQVRCLMSSERDTMQHPDDSEWMPFLYGECEDAQRNVLQRHLESCSHCATKIAGWRNVQSTLDTWTLESPRATAGATGVHVPAVAAKDSVPVRLNHDGSQFVEHPRSAGRSRSSLMTASMVLTALAVSFLTGWQISNAQHPDIADLKKSLSADVRASLVADVRREMQTQFQTLTTDKTKLTPLIESESERIITARLASLQASSDPEEKLKERQMISDILANQITLRNDLEKLAVEAEAQIIRTRRELLRLEAATRPMASEGAVLKGNAPQF
jgi:hypothetical protein